MTCLTRPLLMRPQCEFLLGASADSLALLTGISRVWVVGEWWLPSVNRDAEHCNTLFLLYCRAAPAATASMRFLVRLAERLALLSAQQPLSQAQQQVLQDALHLMRDICARDDSGRGMCGGGNLVASLQAAGFLSTFLALLKALGPIQRPPHQQQAAAAAPPAAQDGSGIPVAELAPALAQQAKGFPADPPYQGWRTDLLAAVANAAHDRPSVKVGRRKAYAWRTPVSCLQLLHLKSPPSRRLALPRGVRCIAVQLQHWMPLGAGRGVCAGRSGAGAGTVPGGLSVAVGAGVGTLGCAKLVRGQCAGAGAAAVQQTRCCG